MKAAVFSRAGGPDVIEIVDLPDPVAGPGEVLVKMHAAGVGMPDMIIRSGKYPWMPPLPAILGIEMSGIVAAVGQGVSDFAEGDKVFLSARDLPVRGGCYAEFIAAPAEALYKLAPETDLDAAAALSNYQVAWHLLNSAPKGSDAKSVLVIGSGGGVGNAILQLARNKGLDIIAVDGGAEKCGIALKYGARAAIDFRSEDVVARVNELTDGVGVDLILDPVGGPDFLKNLEMIAPLGMIVSYGVLRGWPSGDAFAAMEEHINKSPAIRSFTMHTFDSRPDVRKAAMTGILELLNAGKIDPWIGTRLPLDAARDAHELFEGTRPAGKIILKSEM